ncbi:probable DNA double-strand break repair Rad50 ATPase isoform X2 [Drosophila biarmipes]|uniref:probable DNA double-strand break repair Rad50 ATPase isoform X2 n=1 Tax=Drosophila biarmipes TaxID=125945 RepID=UPI0021CCC6D3|nr:probable DNA double-strand break repair Rad50 ATPase isoform X2 [Drosophila biarmipes]
MSKQNLQSLYTTKLSCFRQAQFIFSRTSLWIQGRIQSGRNGTSCVHGERSQCLRSQEVQGSTQEPLAAGEPSAAALEQEMVGGSRCHCCLKEVERERMLIIEGKSDVIPDELADDPIFMVNKDANMEIQKERSKLKTAREKNAERLKQQGVKWERERLQHAAKEAELLAKKRERQRQQKLLVEQYRTEDAERGMDLLRIENEDWRECEKSLKEFLEQERAKMKERSLRISQPFSSDPQDIQNIVRARQKFRETELRIRNQLEDKLKDVKLAVTTQQLTELIEDAHRSSGEIVREPSIEDDEYHEGEPQSKYLDDVTDVSEETVISEDAISLTLAKQQYAEELEAEMEDEFNRGLLISKQQYDQLRFEDEKIVALRNAKDIRELYQLAEEIIMGEIFEEAPEECEEEDVGEEQELEASSDHEAPDPAKP